MDVLIIELNLVGSIGSLTTTPYAVAFPSFLTVKTMLAVSLTVPVVSIISLIKVNFGSAMVTVIGLDPVSFVLSDLTVAVLVSVAPEIFAGLPVALASMLITKKSLVVSLSAVLVILSKAIFSVVPSVPPVIVWVPKIILDAFVMLILPGTYSIPTGKLSVITKFLSLPSTNLTVSL